MLSKPFSAGCAEPVGDPDEGDAVPEDPLDVTAVEDPPPVHAAATTANSEAASRTDRGREVTARDPIRGPKIWGDVAAESRE